MSRDPHARQQVDVCIDQFLVRHSSHVPNLARMRAELADAFQANAPKADLTYILEKLGRGAVERIASLLLYETFLRPT